MSFGCPLEGGAGLTPEEVSQAPLSDAVTGSQLNAAVLRVEVCKDGDFLCKRVTKVRRPRGHRQMRINAGNPVVTSCANTTRGTGQPQTHRPIVVSELYI